MERESRKGAVRRGLSTRIVDRKELDEIELPGAGEFSGAPQIGELAAARRIRCSQGGEGKCQAAQSAARMGEAHAVLRVIG